MRITNGLWSILGVFVFFTIEKVFPDDNSDNVDANDAIYAAQLTLKKMSKKKSKSKSKTKSASLHSKSKSLTKALSKHLQFLQSFKVCLQ